MLTTLHHHHPVFFSAGKTEAPSWPAHTPLKKGDQAAYLDLFPGSLADSGRKSVRSVVTEFGTHQPGKFVKDRALGQEKLSSALFGPTVSCRISCIFELF